MKNKNLKSSISENNFFDITKYLFGSLSASNEKSFEAEIVEDESLLEFTSDVLLSALKLNMTEKELVSTFEESERRVYNSIFQ